MTTKSKTRLNERQKSFCVLYTSKSEFFANGTQSYIEAYNIDLSKKGAYASARTKAYQLLTNGDILDYIRELLETRGLNDQFVDKQLEFLITQNADFSAKLGGIKEYNKLRNRITKNIEVENKREEPDYSNLTGEELSTLLTLMNKSILISENKLRP